MAVWLGPGHVEEFYHGIPNLMVIDSKDEEVKEQLVNFFLVILFLLLMVPI